MIVARPSRDRGCGGTRPGCIHSILYSTFLFSFYEDTRPHRDRWKHNAGISGFQLFDTVSIVLRDIFVTAPGDTTLSLVATSNLPKVKVR